LSLCKFLFQQQIFHLFPIPLNFVNIENEKKILFEIVQINK